MRSFSKLLLICTSVFLVLGLVRFALNGFTGDLLPDFNFFYQQFANFPNVFDEIGAVVARYNGVCRPMDFGSDPAGVIASLIWNLTHDSEYCGSVGFNDLVYIFFLLLSYPIRIVVWLITFIFGDAVVLASA